MTQIRIATRKSKLAIWQAEHVASLLHQYYPELEITLVKITTAGDKIIDRPLNKIGGKGLFIKELEQLLLDNKADIAVHAMKDVPYQLPSGLLISTILKRENHHDALVSNKYKNLHNIPNNAIIGTSSLRRQAQLLAQQPNIIVKPLRGNLDTRIKKLDSGEYDAIILACAGLERLGWKSRIAAELPDTMLSAVGQGAIGIECRQNDTKIIEILAKLNDEITWNCITAERSMNRALGGSCHTPIAGYAEIDNDKLQLTGLVAMTDGSKIIRAKSSGTIDIANEIGQQVAKNLLDQGANSIIASAE